MLKKINNYIYASIVLSLIFIAIGVMCVIKPDISFDVISFVLTIIFIVNGILLLVADFRSRSIFMSNFLSGVLSLVIGIVLLIHPNALKTILPFIVGIWFIVSALANMKFSFYLKNESTTYMILTIIMAIISIVCGFILIVKPLESLDVLIMTLGITFIIHSLSNIIDMFVIKKYINKIVKNIKYYISEFSEW
jgi:uncharacterized membrane protein HdeD (DUF308 family)